ncbi:hypothetical protein Tco_1030054 [Tanacetum coccineum]|uniref:Uncharacterized protein n=1 Tax=Tanacetum coccineum TaxID=301880 RepID=A0ABQ5G562_9ASTR
MITEETVSKTVDVEKEPIQEPQDTKPIPITIVWPTVTSTKTEIIGSSSRPQLTYPIKLVPASKEVHQDPGAPVLIHFEINGKLYNLINEEIQAHVKLEERKEKATQETKLLVLKLKKEKEFKKKRIDLYKWTTTSRCKPETITDILIHPNIKPIVIVKKGNDQRNFDVHNPFRFGGFGITEWDELNEIIPKKNNKVFGELMTSLGKKYKRLKARELEPEVHIPGLEYKRSLPRGVQFVNNKVIEYPKHGIFFIDVFGDHAFQRISNIHKVDVDTLLSYLVMATNINTLDNQRFCAVIRSMIDSHLDKEKLKSKRVKLEAIGYSLN